MRQSPDIKPASPEVSRSSTAGSLLSTTSTDGHLWDVFSDSPPSSLRAPSPPLSSHTQLQAAHHTAGYRDGISAGKESSLQVGFDEGYPLGAELGRRAGRMIGIMEACVAALGWASICSGTTNGGKMENDTASGDLLVDQVKAYLQRASTELRLERLVTAEFFDENGVWKYLISDGEDDDYTFREVVGSHPMMKEWEAIIQSLLDRIGVEITAATEGEAEADGV